MRKIFYFLLSTVAVFQLACTSQKQVTKSPESIAVIDRNPIATFANATIFSDSNFTSAHVGISIYNPESQQYLYNYQGDKYFVPASNMKLFTCYAAMKNLGDSLVGLRYNINETGSLAIQPTGDPTFLHADFKGQPVFKFLEKISKATFFNDNWIEKPLGSGWTWNDYGDYYMAERSSMPIYGNTAKFYLDKKTNALRFMPLVFNKMLLDEPITLVTDSFNINRSYTDNVFQIEKSNSKFKAKEIPFITHQLVVPLFLLNDTLHRDFKTSIFSLQPFSKKSNHINYSQPTDSLLKPMMHNSDNFFAEQTLLMVSNEKLGVMNDEKIIDTLLKTDFKGLPQKPKWVDGSGLSRYNLITPQDFVWVLTKMKNDFSWQRITTILATGGEGTISNFYKNLAGKIFAKTGTLSGEVALSGYLITKQNKTLVFSVLVNNHQTSATAIRRSVEQFLNKVYEQY